MSYDKEVKDYRLLAALLLPSTASFVFSCVVAGMALLGASWSYLQAQPLFGTYFSGKYGFGTLLSQLNTALGDALDSDLAYNIAVICFAVLFGLGVYAVITSVRHMADEARTTLNEVDYADQRTRQVLERSLIVRVVVRGFCGLMWLSYALIYFNGILPFCSSFIAAGSEQALAAASVRNIVAFILLLVATHIHVIFVRLIVLRPRVFGSGSGFIGRGGH